MAFIISDRVKETSITTGDGDVVLNGAYGSFQTFNTGIGDGNTTYYTIENNSRWEVGQGVYTASSNSISRDIIFNSSEGGSKITLEGVSTVFCTLPAFKTFVKDPGGGVQVVDIVSTRDGNIKDLTVDTIFVSGDSNLQGSFSVNSDTAIGGNTLVSGDLSALGDLNLGGDIDADEITSKFLTLIRSNSSGNFFHAYKDDGTNQTVSLWVDDNISPLWRFGLKNNPSDQTATPTFGYIFGRDGSVGSVSDTSNYFSIANTLGFSVQHQGNLVFRASSDTGVYINGKSALYPAFTIQGPPLNVEDLQRWEDYTGTVLSVIDSGGKVGVLTDSPIYDLDVDGSGRLESIYLTSGIYFQDGTFQSTAQDDSVILQKVEAVSGIAIYASGLSDQNEIDIATVSGLLYDDAAISGYFESRVDTNENQIIAISGWADSTFLTSDDSIANFASGLAVQNELDIVTVSGLLTPSGESFDFTSNVLTYNNSYGGSFDVDLSSLATTDVSGEYMSYSNGVITYNDSAGGSFDVDISSISGDVYALIVSGAPSTLDTLNEIAAALNNDENIANTLTSLITNNSNSILNNTASGVAISGNLQSQITENTQDISTVSGLLYSDVALSGYFESRSDTNDTQITAVSGWAKSYVDTQDHNTITVSGALQPQINQNADDLLTVSGLLYDDTYISGVATFASGLALQNESSINTVSGLLYDDTAISGYFESRVDKSDNDISTVSGLLTPSGTHFTLGGNTLTYNNSYGGNFSVDLSSLTTGGGSTSGLPYTSGEYYLQEIRSNSASGVSISGVLQSQITQNVQDIITVSGLTGGGGGTTYNAGSGITIDGSDNIHVYGGSGQFLDLQVRDQLNVSGVSVFNNTMTINSGIKTGLYLNTDSATVTFDMNQSNSHAVTLGGDRTLAVSNTDTGQRFTLRLQQDTTGSRTVTWWDNITWLTSDGNPPSLKTSTNAVDYFSFLHTSGTSPSFYDGFHLTEDASGSYAYSSDLNYVSGIATYASGQISVLENDIITVSGLSGGGGSYDDTYVSGVSTFASGLAIQNQTDIATVSGLLYDDTAISGYFESRTDTNATDIITVSGLLYDDTAISGYFESRVDQADTDIVTVSGLLYDDASLSGYFESRVDSADTSITANSGYFESRADNADLNINTVSGLLYNNWNISDGVSSSDQILSNETVYISGISGVKTSYSNNLLKISANIPAGGLENQILYKISDGSDELGWIDNYATEFRELVKNDTGSGILKGTAVMATGAVGDRIQVAPAVADGSVEPRYMFGIASEDISNSTEGYVTLVGPLKSIVTSGYPIGTVLWLDPSNPGGLTSTQPSSPNLQMSVAIVTSSHATNGRIFVRMWEQQPGIHELHDVNVDVGLASGDLIGYDSSNGVWRNIKNPSGILQSQITKNTNDIVNVSGIAAFASGLSVTNQSNIAANSGYFQNHHISTAAASSSDNSGRTYIQDILLDDYGHVSGINTATETVTDTTYTAGSGLTLTDTEFNVYGGSGQFLDLNIRDQLNVSGTSVFDNTVTINSGIKTGLYSNSDGATVTFDMDKSNSHSVTLAGNRTLAVSNTSIGQKFTLRIQQDAVGSRTVTWWDNIAWLTSDGSQPSLKTSSNSFDYFSFIHTSGSSPSFYDGFHLTEDASGSYPSVADLNYVSGIATYASGQIPVLENDIITVSGLIGGGGTTYSAGSGITIDGSDNIHVYGGSGNFVELTVDNLKLDGNTVSATNTNGSLVVAPNGTGALQADETGDVRGANAVDFQKNRTASTQVASGGCSVIAGGKNNTASGSLSTVSGGYCNTASGSVSTVGGGQNNTASSGGSTISGGQINTASGISSTVGGGLCNTASGVKSIVGGGNSNTASGSYSTVSGGYCNTASCARSTVSGGQSNISCGNYSTVGGGTYNTASGSYSVVAGGGGFLVGNTASGGASTISGGQINTASATYSTVGGGRCNTASGISSTVGGGCCNTASGGSSVIAGGKNNTASTYSIIGGGQGNNACGIYSTISGGSSNTASTNFSTVTGGGFNTATGLYSTVSGVSNTASATSSTVGGGASNTASGNYSVVSGGCGNTASGGYSTVGGGATNTASSISSTVGGGALNTASGNASTVSGGQVNTASGNYSTVAGGAYNTASSSSSTVSGGGANTASGIGSTVSGGSGNTASGNASTVGGGTNNTASGNCSTVGGGRSNTASATYSTVIGGVYAKATKYGEVAHAAGVFAAFGDAQHTVLVARDSTTDATANQVLFLDGSSERLIIPAETTWMFTVKLAAHNDTDNDGGWWYFRGGIRRDASNNTSLIGTVFEESSKDTNLSSASASVVADDTNEALEIRVTGVASKNIRWVAVVDISQVSWGTP